MSSQIWNEHLKFSPRTKFQSIRREIKKMFYIKVYDQDF